MLTEPTTSTDPQDCPDCVAVADICPYHRGWADGWDCAADVVARQVLAQAKREGADLMATLFALLVGLILRLLVWATVTAARTGWRLVTRHPLFSLLLWLGAAAQGWINDGLLLWGLLGLTLWAVLSIASDRWPGRTERRTGAPTVSRVSYNGGSWQAVEHRDPLNHASVPNHVRRRFERARRRHERQLADAGIGHGNRARRARRLRIGVRR